RGPSTRRGVAEASWSLWSVRPTEADEYADTAAAADADNTSYREWRRSLAASSVVRSSKEVRIDRDHKWGPQPFHYRNADYRSIVDGILNQMKGNGGEQS